MTMLTEFLVLSSFFRPECNGYWHVQGGCQFFPMSCLCFAQINSRSSCSKARSCGKPDLLRINSCSSKDPICWLRCHLRYRSSLLLLHSGSFVNLNVVSLQNVSPLVSNKHLFSILGTSRSFPQDYSLSWQADFNCDVLKRTSEESALDRYSIFEPIWFEFFKISSIQNTTFSLLRDLDN